MRRFPFAAASWLVAIASSGAFAAEFVDLPKLQIPAPRAGSPLAVTSAKLAGKLDPALTKEILARGFRVDAIETLPEGGAVLAEFFPRLHADGRVELVVRAQPKVFANSGAGLELLAHVQQATDIVWKTGAPAFDGRRGWMEALINAQQGSRDAQALLAERRAQLAEMTPKKLDTLFARRPFRVRFAVDSEKLMPDLSPAHEQGVRDYFELRHRTLSSGIARARRFRDMEKLERERKWKARSATLGTSEANARALEHAIARNDRAETRRLLDRQIPWELMEPVEQKFWRGVLEDLSHSPGKDKAIVFRGLSGEASGPHGGFPMRTFSSPVGQPFLLASGLADGTGSLRQAVTIPASTESWDQPRSQARAVLQLFRHHARTWKQTPFMGVGPARLAHWFGGRKLAAIQVDPRRIFANPSANVNHDGATYDIEEEHLLPLVVFPDEIVHLEESSKGIQLESFRGEVEKKLGRPLTEAELEGVGNSRFEALQGQRYWRDLYRAASQVPASASVLDPCAGPLAALLDAP